MNQPNNVMTQFTFVKQLVTSLLLTGNGYAYIERKNNVPVALQFIRSEFVTPLVSDNGELIYNITGFNTTVSSKDMSHILNFSYDGLLGISTLQHARNRSSAAYLF